jgi:hypothetical protein
MLIVFWLFVGCLMGIRPGTCPVMSVAGNNVSCLVDSKLVRRITKYA